MRRSVIVVCSIVATLGAASPPAVAAPLGAASLTLEGPAFVEVGTGAAYTGRLTIAGLPAAAQGIRIMAGDVAVATVSTDADGSYRAPIDFPAPGTVALQASHLAELPLLGTRSAPLQVAVGHLLQVSIEGTGSGRIGSAPAGIDCGAGCTAAYAGDRTIELHQTPADDSVFTGWSGDCMGTDPCVLRMDRPRTVGAGFADVVAPTAPALQESAPTGPANHNRPILSGLAEAGAAIAIYATDNCSGAPVVATAADPDGRFSIAAEVADDTATVFRATATDAAGNTGACSASLTYVEDSTSTTPAFLGTEPVSPANHNAPDLRGVTEAGAAVALFAGASCGGEALAHTTASDGGAFDFTVEVKDDTRAVYSARATDTVGNLSACSAALSYVEDSTPPAMAEVTGTSPDSPANDDSPYIKGRAEPGTTVQVFSDAACTGRPLGAGIAKADGRFSVPVAVENDSSTTFWVRAVDAAGNAGPCSTTSVRYREDSTAPDAPLLLGATPPGPADDNHPSIEGTANSLVRLYTSAGCRGPVAGRGHTVGGAFSIPVTVPDDSSTTFWATAADTAGNISDCSSTSITYIEDSTPPEPPQLTGVTPSGPANDNDPAVEGTAEDGATVTLYTDSACATPSAASGVVTGGYFSIAVLVPDDSTTTFYGTATDLAGRTSGCSSTSITYIEDSSVDPPVLTGSTPASPENENGPLIEGTAEAGAFVRLYTTADCTGAEAGSDTATGGAFAIAVSVDDNSTTTFYGTAEDAIGNVSACSTSSVTYVEVTPPPLEPVQISAGTTHSCAVYTDGAARCWGDGTGGKRGDGTSSQSTVPVEVIFPDGSADVVKVSAGGGHTCAILADHSAWCWGSNQFGELGNGSSVPDSSIPVKVVLPAGSDRVQQISAGFSHSCARASNGTLWCWGRGDEGQLGDGRASHSATPVQVSFIEPGLPEPVDITAGGFHSCAALEDGSAWCWGSGPRGQLGDGLSASSGQPVRVTLPAGSPGVAKISAGVAHTCAALGDGSARCWGFGSFGALGAGTYSDSPTPVEVHLPSGSAPVVQISGGFFHSCAVLNDGTGWCWGYGDNGQLGDGNGTSSNLPVQVLFPPGAALEQISAGGVHSCGLLEDRSAWCWGDNGQGQLGDGSSESFPRPVAVTAP